MTAQRIEEFLTYLETERHVSVSTRNQRLAAIHSFFKYIQLKVSAGFDRSSEIQNVPFKKGESKPMNYMSLEEIKLLLSIPDKSYNSQLRDATVLTLLYELGARVQELIDLKPSSFSFGSDCIVMLHGKGNKYRRVPIRKEVASIVKNYIKRCS